MILHACCRTRAVRSAALLAIGIVLGADIVWECLRILGSVGCQPVGAYAGVGQRRGITCIGIGGRRVVSLLQADQGTLGDLGLAPDVYADISLHHEIEVGDRLPRVDSGTELGSMVWVMARRANAATAMVHRKYCMLNKSLN
jgi:hypothetical protein